MQKFDNFYFKSFNFDKESHKGHFFYYFDFQEKSDIKKLEFEEVIDFKSDNYLIDLEGKDDEVIDNILFNIHLALGISYYKLYPTKDLIINSGYIDNKQINFWRKFYLNGLGEFLIRNNIDPKGIISFKNGLLEKKQISKFEIKSNKILLPWGGGKDSIVSSVLLDGIGGEYDFTPFIFGKVDTIKANTLGVLGRKPLLVKRELSENLFSLNKQGYYNGHVPITGIIAFISQLVCYLYDYKYTILSNEKSASEVNTIWKEISINHQYSKSYEFEKDFNDYVSKYISEDSRYFSLLRGIYEYKIAEIFSNKAKKYFSSFSSCNRNFVINTESNVTGNWCNKCEKCCFVYLIMSAFINEGELEKIFGSNLFSDIKLLSVFEELIGISGNKPYECVGTYKECLFSAYKVIGEYKKNDLKLPIILQKIEKNVLIEVEKIGKEKIERSLLKRYDERLIPEEIRKLLNI